MFAQTQLASNTRVKVADPGDAPQDVKWVKDLHINPRTRKQLIEGFWKNHRGITGQVVFVASDAERDRLRKEGKVMVRISDPSAQHITVIVPAALLRKA